ncbi:MAG TPA: c-type cytochrome [Bryobacteraceae bacterium]|nr:c-type cytochrome [Bryobacteraceae bacterium]
MRAFIFIIATAFLLASYACQTEPQQAAASTQPPVPTTIGPVPGPPVSWAYRTNPLTGDMAALQEGRRLFDWYNCSGCHGGHAGGGMGPSLRDPVWIYGDQDAQIFDSIAEGRANGMPAWGTKIPEHQIWELVAYIKSLRTPQEPDPPVEPANETIPPPPTVIPAPPIANPAPQPHQ